MSNKFKTLALLPIFSLFLTACTVPWLANLPVIGPYFAGSGNSSEVTGDIVMWGLWEDPEVYSTLINKFKETNPNINITYEDRSIMKTGEYKNRVFSVVSSEEPEADVILVHNSWVPALAPALAPAESTLINTQSFNSKFYPAAVQSLVLGRDSSAVYGIPAYYDGLVLVYNKAHFAEVGQSFPPTAWEELRRLAIQLTVFGGENGSNMLRGGVALGTADNIDHFSDILGLLWSQADINIPNELNTVPAIEALTYYTNFVLEDRVWSNSMPEATSAFVQGKVSMIFVPSWQILDILEVFPNADDIGVAPVPQALEDSPASWASFWAYVVPKNSKNSKAAWKFINYLGSEEAELMYYSEASKQRPFGPPYAIKALSNDINNPLVKPILDIAPYSKTGIVASRSGNDKEVQALRKAVNDVLTRTQSSDDALKEAFKTITN